IDAAIKKAFDESLEKQHGMSLMQFKSDTVDQAISALNYEVMKMKGSVPEIDDRIDLLKTFKYRRYYQKLDEHSNGASDPEAFQ
ncbi:MAG: hypothetical protein SGCHY_004783, partial [Lobulomycetales sp.]